MTQHSVSAAGPAASAKSSAELLTERKAKSQRARDIAHLRTLDARTLFPILRRRLLDSRPVVGETKTPMGYDKLGRVTKYHREPVYGAPTFRNAIVDGVHV